MPITAEEISRIVGCSTATVSRALNNTGAVSPETRAAIYRTLRDTRYVPQRTRGARKASRKVIQIVYHRHSPCESLTLSGSEFKVGPLSPVSRASLRKPALADNFWQSIIDGAVAEVSSWGYKAALETNISLQDPDFLTHINAPDKAAILLVGEYTPQMKTLVDLCRYPIVLADLICDETHDVVTTDNIAGISAAFDHLYALGHRHIGFVGRYDSNFACAERFTAYQMKMATAGLGVRHDWVYEGYSHIEEAAEGMKRMLSQRERPSAVLCANDCVAMGTIRAAGALGISVPHALSIVGFDDMEAASLVTPSLTTVHVPVQDIGRQAIRLLMIQSKSNPGGPRIACRARLLPQLVIRESTARAAGAVASNQSRTSGGLL